MEQQNQKIRKDKSTSTLFLLKNKQLEFYMISLVNWMVFQMHQFCYTDTQAIFLFQWELDLEVPFPSLFN